MNPALLKYAVFSLFPHRAMPCAAICISPTEKPQPCKINESVQSVFNKRWHMPCGDLASSILLGIDRDVQSLWGGKKTMHSICIINEHVPTVQQALDRSGAVTHCRTPRPAGKTCIQYMSPVAGPGESCFLFNGTVQSILKASKTFSSTSLELLFAVRILAESRAHDSCSVALSTTHFTTPHSVIS